MITEYRLELLEELRLPRRRCRRILAEVEDHLACAAAELRAGGLEVQEAERESVRRFGPAVELAQMFVEQEAALGGKRVARAAGVLAALLAVLVLGAAGGVLPWGSGPAIIGLPLFVLPQVALVAAGLTLVRVWRAAPDGGPRGARLALVLRGALVVVSCAVGSVVCGAVDVLASWSGRGWTPAAWLALVGLALGGAVTGATLSRSRRLAIDATRPVHRVDDGGAWESQRGGRSAGAFGDSAVTRGSWALAASGYEQDPLADLQAAALLALTRLQRRVPMLGSVLGNTAWLVQMLPAELRRRAPRVSAWLDLRRHPWRFGASVATTAGLALAAGHAITEGVSSSQLVGALLAAGLIAAIEALAALLGFALLGRVLGIRTPRGS